MRKEINFKQCDFAEPYCGSLVKNSHVWRNYHIQNAKRLNLKGLSLIFYKLMMPLCASFKNPTTGNYYVN